MVIQKFAGTLKELRFIRTLISACAVLRLDKGGFMFW